MLEEPTQWKRGDVLVIAGRHVDDAPRKGEILDVLGERAHPHFSVRWADGHESIFYPAQDVALRHENPRG